MGCIVTRNRAQRGNLGYMAKGAEFGYFIKKPAIWQEILTEQKGVGGESGPLPPGLERF